MLEFLGLPDTGKLLESKLESALMDKLQQFLLELERDREEIEARRNLESESE